ncbi:MAG: T9SS type A sorting domain-containing protein, partial [Rhodothermales bacterium]
LVFDFGNPMPNMNPINFDNTYNKASIFFDFQCNLPPTASGPGIYYWDDVAFGDVMPVASEDGSGLPRMLELTQNYPNPFGASTTIHFSLPSAEYVGVYVYNVLGQRVATLAEETLEAGDHALSFDASGLASGTYFYRLNHGAGSLTRSMVLTR